MPWWNLGSSSDKATDAPPPGVAAARDSYQLSEDEGVRIAELSLSTSVDEADYDRITNELLDSVAAWPDATWVVDLARTEYVGSPVLGLLINIRQILKQGEGRLVLAGLKRELQDIFRLTSMERLFTICRTRADALRVARRG